VSHTKRLLAVAALALAAWLARAAAAPTIAIRLSPPNPAAGQPVVLTGLAPEDGGWVWDFGDGGSAQCSSALHTWGEPGTYRVHAQNQASSAEISVVVSPADTLRLNGAHPFEATAEAVDPRTGDVVAGQALGQDDGYGYFRFPAIPGEADGPSLSLRVHDPGAPAKSERLESGRGDDRYRVSWGSLTDLEYTLTLRDAVTGQVQIYRGAGPFAGGVDATNFPRERPDRLDTTRPGPFDGVPGRELAFSPTPGSAATVTPTAISVTPGPGATRTPTKTRTPTATRTPTSTPSPTITPTPTPSGPPFVTLRAIQWQWDFISPDLGLVGGSSITLQVGQTYQIQVCNEDLPDVTDVHQFGGISALGLNGGQLPNGVCLAVQTITPSGSGDYPFNCTNYCGVGHDGMTGIIHVIP